MIHWYLYNHCSPRRIDLLNMDTVHCRKALTNLGV